jgi:dolichol-phosphate mannosyltransferase
MRTLVVLPTYNESENIETVVRRVREVVPTADILVVDDGSPDGTADIAEKLAVELGQIEVLRRAAKSGLGSAYRAGFRIGLERDYDAFVEMDSDLSHDPDALPSLLAASEAGADLVIGSRYVAGGRTPHWPWYRLAISRGGNLYARSLLGLEVRDSTAGFRVYSRRALTSFPIDEVRAEGYGFQVEMTYRVHGARGSITEVPIEFRDRELGTSKMSGRIVFEALVLVAWWAVRDRILRRSPGSGPSRRPGDGSSVPH